MKPQCRSFSVDTAGCKLMRTREGKIQVSEDGVTWVDAKIVEHDQTDLGASDDRPLGPDNSLYRNT